MRIGKNVMTRKLKIAQVVSLLHPVPPISQNGLEFVVSWITEELVRRGHDVTLFAPADSVTKAKLISLLPHGISSDPKVSWENYTFSIWNTILAGSMAEKFDVIHCHNGNAQLIAPFISKPLIETAHNPMTGEFFNFYEIDKKYSDYVKPISDLSSKVHQVAISKSQQQLDPSANGVTKKNSSIIYNGIPVNNFEFNASPENYLLFIGYINKNKGADIAVQVAKKLDMRLILAGSTKDEEKFFNEHIKPHLSEKITYVGPVNFEEKNKLYKNAIAKLAPLQWDEPFGLTLVEAQACGTPVIAFNRGAASEIIMNGETGYVVENTEEMCEAIKKINLISRHACRAWVEKNFSVEKMVDQYEALYEKLLNEKSTAAKNSL